MKSSNKKVKVNGEWMSQSKAMKIIDDKNIDVTELSVSIGNEGYDEEEAPTEVGFEVPRDLILSLYRKMKAANGSDISAEFKRCKTLGHATVTVKIEAAK